MSGSVDLVFPQFEDYPDNRKAALKGSNWKRWSKKVITDIANIHHHSHPGLFEDPDENDEATPRFNIQGSRITERWFTNFAKKEDDPDPRLHARVYEQDGSIIHVWLYDEG